MNSSDIYDDHGDRDDEIYSFEDTDEVTVPDPTGDLDRTDLANIIGDGEPHNDSQDTSQGTPATTDQDSVYEGLPTVNDNDLTNIHVPTSVLAANTVTKRLDALIAIDHPLIINARLHGMVDPRPCQELTTDLVEMINRKIGMLNHRLVSMASEAKDKIKADQNSGKGSGAETGNALLTKRKGVNRLGFNEIAIVLAKLHDVVLLAPSDTNSDPDLDMLAVYDADPSSDTFGTYQASSSFIRKLARHYCNDLTTKEFAEVTAALTDITPRRYRRTDKDLIAMNNGIFDYRNKVLIPFSPKYIFVAKATVNYNPDATNPVITNDTDGTTWDVVSWIHELFTDELPTPPGPDADNEILDDYDREYKRVKTFNEENTGLEHLIWQIIGATLRPYVAWNKSAWFYSTQGNNGKGTLIELMRNIIGPQSYASIPVADFGKDFLLEPLTRASAILVDENDVGSYIERAANLKAVITNDVITINRKFRSPIAYQFFGFMVQCINDRPKIKDKSDSLYRRQLYVPFFKSFTGAERRYIKTDYIKRADVLEYIAYRVLNEIDDYYELDNPPAAQLALEEAKEDNDPLRSFWNDIREEVQWTALPKDFLYDLYRAWSDRFNPNNKPPAIRKFCTEMKMLVDSDREWEWVINDHVYKHMDDPEVLITKYKLENWINENAPKNNQRARSTLDPSQRKSKFTGLKKL